MGQEEGKMAIVKTGKRRSKNALGIDKNSAWHARSE